MTDSIESHRSRVLAEAETIVVKIGTNALSRSDDTLDSDRIAGLASQLVRFRREGRRVVVVSSGAIGAGLGLLGLKQRPKDLPHLQAAAALGQAELIRVYDDALCPLGHHAAQILITANDFRRRARYLNLRNTLHTLFEYDVIPVINENDTVSIDEIKFGDNDRLAAMVTNLVERPLLVILTVVDGFLDGPPGDPASRVIPLVTHWDEALKNLAASTKSVRGTGGMQSKLEAVRTATQAGVPVIIANGTDPLVLTKVADAAPVGTLFLGKPSKVPAWKRWIGFTAAPTGKLWLDAGAAAAVTGGGRSLLAIGVRRVEGSFNKGELVSILSPDGLEFARGLINFDARTTEQIAGQRTERIIEILGGLPYAEVIHRDNLMVIRES